jgi:hypothetical protein
VVKIETGAPDTPPLNVPPEFTMHGAAAAR